MSEIRVATLSFLCLIIAGIGTLITYDRLPAKHLQDDTNGTIRLLANVFVVIASLVLGLLMNSAKNTFEAVDHNIHAFATDLILLDRAIRTIGPEADEAHRGLVAYVQQALVRTPVVEADREAGRLLDQVGTSLRAIKLTDAEKTPIWNDARELYHEVVRQRWVIIEQSDGTIPPPLIIAMIIWLVLIFASFGYRAPRNATVVTMFVVSALLISGSIYLVIDMDVPTSGFFQASSEPLERALAELQR